MNLSTYTKAIIIATALYAICPVSRKRASQEDMADSLYETVGALRLSDDSKADVYAKLAEGLTATTGFREACDVIDAALREVKHG